MAKATHEEAKVREMLGRIFESRREVIDVSPSWLATEVMQELDPGRASHPLEYSLAHLQLRQMARALCAGRWEREEAEDEQHELFPGLQRRYPIAGRTKSDEPEYRLLEYLTTQDIAFNVGRLRSEARSKLAHADRLYAWGKDRSGGELVA
jgi:hypothetical protein